MILECIEMKEWKVWLLVRSVYFDDDGDHDDGDYMMTTVGSVI